MRNKNLKILSCLKIFNSLFDYFAQNAKSQSRQGFQLLQASGVLIKSSWQLRELT